MERVLTSDINAIRAAEYAPFSEQLQHLFLVGNLQQPCPHPFVRDQRLEIILCHYESGDQGRFHWHPGVTEYEFVIEGAVTYQSAANGQKNRFETGDLSIIPAGICVKRLGGDAS